MLGMQPDRTAQIVIAGHTEPFCGIAATGWKISTQELVIYRFADGKLVQCWGDLFPWFATP